MKREERRSGRRRGDGELLYWPMVILRAREGTTATKPNLEARSGMARNSKQLWSPTSLLIGATIIRQANVIECATSNLEDLISSQPPPSSNHFFSFFSSLHINYHTPSPQLTSITVTKHHQTTLPASNPINLSKMTGGKSGGKASSGSKNAQS